MQRGLLGAHAHAGERVDALAGALVLPACLRGFTAAYMTWGGCEKQLVSSSEPGGHEEQRTSLLNHH